MANKSILNVDKIDSLESSDYIFVNSGNKLRQIKKSNLNLEGQEYDLDESLSLQGKAADARATGQALQVLSDKNDSRELDIERLAARVEYLIQTKPESGDTTSEEIQDMRIGYDGVEYTTAGKALRSQIAGIPNEVRVEDNKLKFYNTNNTSNPLLFETAIDDLVASGLNLEELELSVVKNMNSTTLYLDDGTTVKHIDIPNPVDSVLSMDSTNPIQNKIVAEEIQNINDEIKNIKENGIGGGEIGVTVRLTNQNGTSTLIGSYGNTIPLMFTFTSTENDLPTGNANCKITVNSIQKVNMSIPQGLTSIDIAPYLNIGSNTVIVTCTDIFGKARSLTYDITVVQLSIDSTFNATVPYDGDILFKYKPYGAIEKTIHFVIDGEEIGTVITSLSGKDMSRTIPKMSHGAHRLEVYSTASLNDTHLESPKLAFDIICIEEGNTTPIIASVCNVSNISQGEQLSIPYIVYDPTKLACDITLTIYTMNAGVEVVYQAQNITVSRLQQEWNTRKYPIGETYFRIAYGDIAPKIHQITVAESKIKIEVEKQDLELNLIAEGRSNNETNPASWTYGNVTTTFENMNWKSVGWINDDYGDACLRLSGDAKATVQFQPFSEDLRVYGKTLEFKFAIKDVNNRNAVPIRCINNGIGFEIKADTAYIQSEQSNVFCNYKEEEIVHLAFVIESKDEYRMLSVYLNGTFSDSIQYPSTDNFQQLDPVSISIGSPYCSVDLYAIRSYSTALSRSTLANNYIADVNDIVRKTEAWEDNDIYDDFGNVSFSKAKAKNSIMIIVGSLPTYKGDKKKCKIYYYDVEDSNLDFNESDVSIDVQGTSSQFLNLGIVHGNMFEKIPIELLEHPKAKYTTTQSVKINVMVVKTEKNIWIAYGQTLSAVAMGNQQLSLN